MKKLIALLLAGTTLIALAGCAAAAPAASAAPAAETAAEEAAPAEGAEETFVFKHGFDLDYPPYSYIDDSGKTGGFDVELAQAVCDYYGLDTLRLDRTMSMEEIV